MIDKICLKISRGQPIVWWEAWLLNGYFFLQDPIGEIQGRITQQKIAKLEKKLGLGNG